MKRAASMFAWAACSVTACHVASSADIRIPGSDLHTESITSTADGSVIIGAMGPGAIFRAQPGASTAEVWIKPGTDGLTNVLGVYADENTNTLWACSFLYTQDDANPQPSNLHAFDLATGAPKGRWPLPTAGALCNDIAVGTDGNAYVTDSNNMEIVVLKPGATSLEVWAGDGAFGPRGSVLDGIAIVRDRVVVNAFRTGRLFSVQIRPDGSAGSTVEVRLDRLLEQPDGQRSMGGDALLVVDAGEGGRLTRIALSGEQLETGSVTTLKTGFPDGPASVTLVRHTAYVVEGRFASIGKPTPKAYQATAIEIPH